MKSDPEANALPDDYPWVNFGLRPPAMKQIRIAKPTVIHGRPLNVGDVIQVTEADSKTLIACGKATSYPPTETKEESPEELAEQRRKALGEGPYKVEITRRCQVRSYTCEPGETVCLDEEGAMCLTVSGRGKIISKPGEENVRERIARVVEEMLRGGRNVIAA